MAITQVKATNLMSIYGFWVVVSLTAETVNTLVTWLQLLKISQWHLMSVLRGRGDFSLTGFCQSCTTSPGSLLSGWYDT